MRGHHVGVLRKLAVYSTGMTSCDTCMGGDIITEMNTIPCDAFQLETLVSP
jgi:hypothetical protein